MAKKFNLKKKVENNCFDCFIGIMGWITGCIQGVLVESCILCSEKKDDNIMEELDIFVHEMELGYKTGKDDTKLVGKLI